MIRNIILDMGGVLIAWDPEALVNRYTLSPAEKKQLRRELFEEVEWVALDAGTMTHEEVIPAVMKRLPAKMEPMVRELVTGWWKHRQDVPGMADLLRSLRHNGYFLYLLSNADVNQHCYFDQLPAADCFAGGITSADEHLLKPEKEIYLRLLAKYSLRAEECFLVDDNAHNVYSAKALGMQGAVFHQDLARLRKDMAAAGIRTTE